MPGLSDILRRIIVEQVAAMMVLPNKLPIILSDKIEALSLKMPEPQVKNPSLDDLFETII